MKVLYCNPIFLDYRLPFYKKLVELFDGQFYVLYSVNRYLHRGNAHLIEEIPRVLGANAIPYTRELLYNTYEHSFTKYNGEKGKRIPIARGFLGLVRKVKADVLITEGFFQWTPLLLVYKMFHRVKLLLAYERTLYTERNAGFLKTLHRKLTDKFIDAYLVNGSETKKYLESIGVKPNKIVITGMSADSEGLSAGVSGMTENAKENFKKGLLGEQNVETGLMYLFAGQMVERKGVSYLLDAWKTHVARYPHDHLVLIGRGPLLETFRAIYEEWPSIHLLGGAPYADVYKYYAVADVFVLPTTEDNWSLVVPEAMACGLPVATSVYNGCHPELIREGVNGYVFDTFKQDSIVEVLGKFHGKDLRMMGRASKEFERPFNTEHCARREYEAIMACVGRREE